MEGAPGDFVLWNDKAEMERPDWLAKRFVEEFNRACEDQNIEFCCLESLYRPNFAQSIRAGLSGSVVVVFVDIPQEIRITRQMIREGLASIEEARAYIIPRDQKKEEWGTDKVKDIADEVVDNSGTLDDLYRRIDEMLHRHQVPTSV